MTRPASIRKRQAKLRSEFYNHPWAMETAALSRIGQAIETGDIESIQASLSFGTDDIESSMKIVNGVAVIPISGVLRDGVDYMVRWGGACSYQLLERDIAAALGNDMVKAIVFYCNSPGGSAIGCKRVADFVFANRGKKPMVAFVQGQCCSAAYYIAAAANRIESTADSMVGSIGTIMPHVEMKGFLDEIGYGVTVITNSDSPKKGHGNQYEKLTPEGKATLQSFIDSFGKPFIADVARYRGITSEDVVANFGQGDAKRADLAINKKMIDIVVGSFSETLARLSPEGQKPQTPISNHVQSTFPVAEANAESTIVSLNPAATGPILRSENMKVSQKVRAQLFALDLIDSTDVSDEVCVAALKAWFRGSVPSDEAAIMSGLRNQGSSASAAAEEPTKPASNVVDAHNAEQAEARLADLKASADLINQAAGYSAVSGDMVIAAFEAKMGPQAAIRKWNETLSSNERSVPTAKVTGEGRDRFGVDAIDALLYRAGNTSIQLSAGASSLVNRPLWAIAGECLALSGAQVDMYGDRELVAEQAMSMGDATRRVTFFSNNENRQYISSASNSPFSRPGDFPNILSGLANKYLDMIELDDDYSYPEISAVLPGGLKDFKPAMMINKGIMEEMDELSDSEQIKDLGVAEEVLSYIFLRRFGNRFGWTPVMVANDDLGAFAEGMLGLAEAWEVTQNRLVLDRFTGNETLLDGNALFSNRADTGAGVIPAANNNDRTAGLPPSDAEWGTMSTLYAGIGGVQTGRRVRGTLNTILVPTNAVHQAAVRTFETYPVLGETKVAESTANLGIYRNKVRIIPESELNSVSATQYYGLRNPTKLNTATVVRAYFNGYGTAGRRERWYDPATKTTYVSLEGRIATAVKNWRYAIRNAGVGG